jgi:hypothetical protein
MRVGFAAGLCLLDLTNNVFWVQNVLSHPTHIQVTCELTELLLQISAPDYGYRNLQARVISHLLYILFATNPTHNPLFHRIVALISDAISGESGDDSIFKFDTSVRALTWMIERL